MCGDRIVFLSLQKSMYICNMNGQSVGLFETEKNINIDNFVVKILSHAYM